MCHVLSLQGCATNQTNDPCVVFGKEACFMKKTFEINVSKTIVKDLKGGIISVNKGCDD